MEGALKNYIVFVSIHMLVKSGFQDVSCRQGSLKVHYSSERISEEKMRLQTKQGVTWGYMQKTCNHVFY